MVCQSIIICLLIILIFYLSININNTKLYLRQSCLKALIKYQLHLFIPYINHKIPTNKELLSLLHPINQLPKLQQYEIIPNILFHTYYNKLKIPQYIFNGIYKYASNYEHILFNDKDTIQFLKKYFNKKIVQRFNELKLGAHKADLLRYCYLYVYGGVYLDIKINLIKPLDEIFINKTYFYTCTSVFNKTIYNGIIASKPRNIIFLKLINYIINIPLYIINLPMRVYYLSFCFDLYKEIKNDLKYNSKINKGLNVGYSQNYYLFKEIEIYNINNTCTNFNRSGKCGGIYDKEELIFITRDSKFPW